MSEPIIRYKCNPCLLGDMTRDEMIAHLAEKHHVKVNDLPTGGVGITFFAAAGFETWNLVYVGGVEIEEKTICAFDAQEVK